MQNLLYNISIFKKRKTILKIDFKYDKTHIGWWYFLALGVVILDLVAKILLDGKNLDVINGFFGFVSVHNFGASFGMLSGAKIFFIVLAVAFMAGMIVFDIFYNKNSRSNGWYKVGFTLVLGGLIGNLIDRIFLGYVRDFIHFEFMDFPVFNIADIALTVGCICLAIYLVFFCRFDKKEQEKTTNSTTENSNKNVE